MDEFLKLWNGLVQDVSQEFDHLVDNVLDTIDTVSDLVEETLLETQKLVVEELERNFPYLNDEEFWVEFWDFEDTEDSADPYRNIYGVDPMSNPPQLCQSCVHFHGWSYNGTPLVCGMHPYGPTGDSCPDWSE